MKKNAIFFGALLVVILMVSSATVTTMAQLNEYSKLGKNVTSDNPYVEPGIYLSGFRQRKILSDSLCYIDNPDAHLLVQAIIAEMDLKGFVNSYDIEQIVNYNTLELHFIAGVGSPITTGAYPNPGRAIWVGHPFQNSGTVIFGVIFWTARHSYDPAREINITISFNDGACQGHIVDDHSGLSIGFSGTFSNGQEETGHWFTMHGSAILHII